MKVLIIANPIAGGGVGTDRAEELAAALRENGATPEVFITQKAGDAAERARDAAGFDCVVSVGGDGSANEVASSLAGGDVPMAIMPLGTANVLASELGHPANPHRLAELIAKGHTRRIDRGVYGGGHFVMCAGAGIDAAIVQEVAKNRGSSLGYSGWIRPVLELLASYTYPPFRVYVDDRLICEEAQCAVIGNCRYSAGVLCLTPEAHLDDGLFDICVFHHVDSLIMIRMAIESFGPGFSQKQEIIYEKGKSVRFEPIETSDIPLQIDGDPAGTIPAAFTIEPDAVPVITRG